MAAPSMAAAEVCLFIPAGIWVYIYIRAQRLSGARIADRLGLPLSTVGDVLRRHGFGPLTAADPVAPDHSARARAAERAAVCGLQEAGPIEAGTISHRITGNRAVRGRRQVSGWEYLHVGPSMMLSRIAYAVLLPDETAASAVAFLAQALAFLQRLGVTVEAVMTDNGFCYPQRTYAAMLAQHGLRHLRTRPCTPRTNDKAERFIQNALREWAYVKSYRSSAHRAGALAPLLTTYNMIRPHTSHSRMPPVSRLGL